MLRPLSFLSAKNTTTDHQLFPNPPATQIPLPLTFPHLLSPLPFLPSLAASHNLSRSRREDFAHLEKKVDILWTT